MSSAFRATALSAALLLLPATGASPAAHAAPGTAAEPSGSPKPAGAESPRAAPRRSAAPSAPPVRLVLRGKESSVGAVSTGEYGGVTPGLPTLPRIVLPRDASQRCYVTWTGFQVLPSGSRVFLQLNRTPDKAVHTTAGEIRVELGGCRVYRWNNLRPLDLRFFDTPVSSARVRWSRRQGATLHVQLKRAVQPQVEVAQLQGWTYLFLTFHHPRARPAPTSPPRRSAAPPRDAPKGPSPP